MGQESKARENSLPGHRRASCQAQDLNEEFPWKIVDGRQFLFSPQSGHWAAIHESGIVRTGARMFSPHFLQWIVNSHCRDSRRLNSWPETRFEMSRFNTDLIHAMSTAMRPPRAIRNCKRFSIARPTGYLLPTPVFQRMIENRVRPSIGNEIRPGLPGQNAHRHQHQNQGCDGEDSQPDLDPRGNGRRPDKMPAVRTVIPICISGLKHRKCHHRPHHPVEHRPLRSAKQQMLPFHAYRVGLQATVRRPYALAKSSTGHTLRITCDLELGV